jgi:hypothetical protein
LTRFNIEHKWAYIGNYRKENAMESKVPNQLTFEEAERAAGDLAEQVKQKGLAPAFAELENALLQFGEAGNPIDTIVPASAKLGFSLTRARDGKSFWDVYSEVVREELCKKDGELQKLVKAGLSGSTGAILTAVMTGLGLPGVALAIAIPIAAILAAKGVDAFCRFTEEEPESDR